MTAKQDYLSTTEIIYSIFRDCRRAFELSLQSLKSEQESMLRDFASKGQKWTIDDLDKKGYHYGIIDERNGSVRSVATITQGKWKSKIGKDGTNIRIIGNMCLVMIYQYWEDKYREEIATSNGIAKDELQSDLFGDICHLRNSIIHNHGRAISKVSRCKILKWFKEGDEVIIDAIKMDHLIDLIRNEINAF